VANTGTAYIWSDADGEKRRMRITRRVVWWTAILVAVGLSWAYVAVLDEVSTGSGRVIPTMREQVIQSLEGGILTELAVREDEIVNPGQVLARLDPVKTESNVEESAAKYRAALASSARLRAEVSGTELVFPAELDAHADLRASERKLYDARRRGLEETLGWIKESTELVRHELEINETLTKMGAASKVEVIRLKRQLADLELKAVETQSQYIVAAREELAKANAEVQALASVVRGRADSLARLTIRSPVRGIVKNIEVTTINGVIPPNGKLMDIVPVDDLLLVEARISPRDIAFIHPDQRASVKITAYDYAIYGALEGKVTSISADTIQDETDPNIFYYRVFIETESDALVNEAGKRFPITPGMVATVDIHTGSKTVFEYLLKPFNKAREALRER
jgi:adhesin transport system membrane fusion protein